MHKLTLTTLVCLGTLALFINGCSDDCDSTQPPATTPTAQFAGSQTCGNCHDTTYDEWADSGHPYKVTKIEGEAPVGLFPDFSGYPNDAINPPQGKTWADITYTIGGYGWKMRWMDENGYIMTSGVAAADAQYNFFPNAPDHPNADYTTYHTEDEPGTKPYDCGRCHTTGWVADDDAETDGDLSDNQDGLEGIWGTFYAGGIHCEECHGKGSLHAGDPQNVDMIVDASSQFCGNCHTRDSLNRIAASSGFVRHHEQYDEWVHSPHGLGNGPGCNDCHDPHASVRFDADAAGTGMLMTCTDCHDAAEYTLDGNDPAHPAFPTCTDCHMPDAAKSAWAGNIYTGDVTSHILAINTDPVDKTTGMFTADGKFVQTENSLAKVTLDFACYSCHKDGNDVGGTWSNKTLQQLSDMATGIHPSSGKRQQVAQK